MKSAGLQRGSSLKMVQLQTRHVNGVSPFTSVAMPRGKIEFSLEKFSLLSLLPLFFPCKSIGSLISLLVICIGFPPVHQ